MAFDTDETPPTPEPEAPQPVGNPEHGPDAAALLAGHFDAAVTKQEHSLYEGGADTGSAMDGPLGGD